MASVFTLSTPAPISFPGNTSEQIRSLIVLGANFSDVRAEVLEWAITIKTPDGRPIQVDFAIGSSGPALYANFTPLKFDEQNPMNPGNASHMGDYTASGTSIGSLSIIESHFIKGNGIPFIRKAIPGRPPQHFRMNNAGQQIGLYVTVPGVSVIATAWMHYGLTS